MLDALDLASFCSSGKATRFSTSARRARERHEHVRHRHVDLRLFLARGDQHRDEAEQQRGQREDRRQRRILERRASGPKSRGAASVMAHVARARSREPVSAAGRIGDDLLARIEPGEHLDAIAEAMAEPQLAQSQRAIVGDDVDARSLRHARTRARSGTSSRSASPIANATLTVMPG